MLIVFIALAAVAGVGCLLTERVDRPRRRALRDTQMQPAE